MQKQDRENAVREGGGCTATRPDGPAEARDGAPRCERNALSQRRSMEQLRNVAVACLPSESKGIANEFLDVDGEGDRNGTLDVGTTEVRDVEEGTLSWTHSCSD